MKLRSITKLVMLVFAAATLMASMPVMAAVLYDSEGFEGPTFSAGDLTGQDSVPGPWIRDGSLGSATVQSTVFQSGSQAVRVDRAAGGEDRWSILTLAPTSSNDIVQIEWDMRVDAQTAVTGTFGPFLGIEAYDTNATFALLGALYVDATTSELVTLDADSNVAPISGHTATLGSWHNYDMHLDFTAETYTVYQDDVLVDLRPFVDLGEASISSFTDAPIAAIRAGSDATATSLIATAYFDNYLLTEVPEPTSLALMGSGCLLLLSRQRRRA